MVMSIKDIKRAGVPLCSIESSDPAATIRGVLDALGITKESPIPIVQWDICSGLVEITKAGKAAIKWYDPLAMQLTEILKGLRDNPVPGMIVFFHSMARYWDRDGVAQGVWNLRDVYKGCGSIAVLLGPDAKLPAELRSDVIVITEPPPGKTEIEGIVSRILEAAGKAGAKVDGTDKPAVVGALQGLLSAFDVEQTLSLSVLKTGVDVPGCWERKIKRLKASTGAEIVINNPTFASLAGCDNVKGELLGFINGRQRPGVVFFLDEIEKLFAGAGTDLSGVTTSLVGMFLSWTADRKVRGFLFPGVPGSGKTWSANCAAGEAKVPFVKAGDLKDSLVGGSEAKMRAMLSAVDALAGDGSIMMIASCNWVDNIAPDILSRFTMGSFFYDFPTDPERKVLWKMYGKVHELPKQPLPDSDGWTGREIDACCWRARQFNRTLLEVAKNVCPASVSQKGKLDALRKSCSGRFLSAAVPGVYEYREVDTRAPGNVSADRTLNFD